MNTTMIVTLLGAAASDALESGQVVSGVGGQYNFVAMAHALPDARLLMMLRATHDNKDGLQEQHRLELRPRHDPAPPARHRDHRVRRGRPARPVRRRGGQAPDRDRRLALPGRAGRARPRRTASWRPTTSCPSATATTCRRRWRTSCTPGREAGLLPDFPFGTDLTDDELHIVRALKKLKHASAAPGRTADHGRSRACGKARKRRGLPRAPGPGRGAQLQGRLRPRLFAGNL